jgi:hypothetical protein
MFNVEKHKNIITIQAIYVGIDNMAIIEKVLKLKDGEVIFANKDYSISLTENKILIHKLGEVLTFNRKTEEVKIEYKLV